MAYICAYYKYSNYFSQADLLFFYVYWIYIWDAFIHAWYRPVLRNVIIGWYKVFGYVITTPFFIKYASNLNEQIKAGTQNNNSMWGQGGLLSRKVKVIEQFYIAYRNILGCYQLFHGTTCGNNCSTIDLNQIGAYEVPIGVLHTKM